MSDDVHSNDFVVSAHAMERFEERFPELWTSDEDAAYLIHGECEDALTEGRASFIAPLELANNDLDRWEAGKGLVVWVPDKTRGYVLLESDEGLLVTTVLKGKTPSEARGMLYGEGGRPRRRSRNRRSGSWRASRRAKRSCVSSQPRATL